ncbi:4'-phosphopantetheinyl transferase superfamily protein [Streptomyces sp. T-3]|nr:4'-phosphopantetheinyl transferase superfamily protein [Streptomyces sp. T-3]
MDLLDAEERRRATALRRDSDRAVFIAAHTGLRRLLGAYTDADPATLDFIREPCPGCGGPHGRPALAGHPLHFSLSHTRGGLALLGFADRPVGVDIEARPGPEAVEDAALALHEEEQAALAALSPDDRTDAFSRCWTRKEAYLKGTGEGLGGVGALQTLVGTGPEPLPVPGWEITDVPVPEGFTAACAVREV